MSAPKEYLAGDKKFKSDINKKYGFGHQAAEEKLSNSQMDFLFNLEEFKLVSINNTNILMCHGSPKNKDEYIYPDTRKEILDQIKMVGVNNIIILPVSEEAQKENSEEEEGKTLKKKYSPGLSLKDAENILELPTGSVLIKHFYYNEPDGTENFIETRLLIRQEDGWQAETYIWNEAQTEASRSVLGDTQELTVNVDGVMQSFSYLIPNQNQCKNCHSDRGELVPIGPTVANLNKDYPYDFGMANQLTTWMERSILAQASLSDVGAWPKLMDTQADLNERARAYLAVNCASCHRRHGSAANSGLYLEYDNEDPLSLGLWKTPVAAGNGSGGLTYVIHPGEADQSILLYRMIAEEVDARMPEIGRELIHEDGIALIRDWIDNM